jgi:hypothetical protein
LGRLSVENQFFFDENIEKNKKKIPQNAGFFLSNKPDFYLLVFRK